LSTFENHNIGRFGRVNNGEANISPSLCSTKWQIRQQQQQSHHHHHHHHLHQYISLLELHCTELMMAENPHHAVTTAQGQRIENRRQGEYMAIFLLHMIMNKLQTSDEYRKTVAGKS